MELIVSFVTILNKGYKHYISHKLWNKLYLLPPFWTKAINEETHREILGKFL